VIFIGVFKMAILTIIAMLKRDFYIVTQCHFYLLIMVFNFMAQRFKN